MRNGNRAIVERVKTYHWTHQFSKGKVTLAEGVDCCTWSLLMWNTDGQRAPSALGESTPYDLIELIQEADADGPKAADVVCETENEAAADTSS